MENNDTQRIPAHTASDAADPQRLNCGGDIIWCIIENGPAAPVERLSRRRRGPVFWAGTSRKLCGCADARNTPIRRSLMAALPNDWLAREPSIRLARARFSACADDRRRVALFGEDSLLKIQ